MKIYKTQSLVPPSIPHVSEVDLDFLGYPDVAAYSNNVKNGFLTLENIKTVINSIFFDD